MTDEPSDWFEDEDGHRFLWPLCPVDGCANRICLRLNSDKCYPHTFGLPSEFMTAKEDEPHDR